MYFDLPWKPLYPSQRSGELLTRSASWHGREREFFVQWYEDRVYFGLLQGERRTWATLATCREDEAIACFEEALAQRRWGVCFSRHWSVYRRNFDMDLQFIFAPDGTGLLREWSSREWLAFAPQETRVWAFLPELVLPTEGSATKNPPEASGCYRAAIHCVEDELLMRLVSNEEIERLSFRCRSDEAEFKHVVRWLWNTQLVSPSEGLKWTNISLTSEAQATINFYSARWNGSLGMMNWLQAYFASEGFNWMKTCWGKRRYRKLRKSEPQLRAFWQPVPVWWSVTFNNRDQPTAHEQLEARLSLRDWLRGKVRDYRIETWLAPI